MSRVIRYVLTYCPDKPNKTRTLVFPAQGRYTYESRADAEASRWLHMTNDQHGLARVLSPTELATVAVRPCECWAEHFDPVGVWFAGCDFSRPMDPGLGLLLSVAEFRECVADGSFSDYDGFGHPSDGKGEDRSVRIYPSDPDSVPDDATHVVWYNR